jgi:hypothetical protein
MEPFTPSALRDLYLNLSKDDRDIFLKLIASHCTGREPLMMLGELPRTELWKHNSIVYGSLIKTAMPILITKAREIAKNNPLLSNEEFDRQLEVMVTEFVKTERDVVAELERERFKEDRERKPDVARLERGKLIRDANKNEGVSWKKMPSFVLKKYPEWFPEYKDNPPTGQDKERFKEQLRRMARDAKNA